MKKELLAPAGDIEAGYAAIHYGADAVYIGLKNFSARATIVNFGESELNEFVGYAHSKKRKVFVAINTIVQEQELPQLISSLDICIRCNIDAVIIQDLGVARVVREAYPELEMHASTQMAVHNVEGALELQKIGFKRVVLARELNLDEIKAIALIPGLETEIFIHGALCYSYSGLCFFSSTDGKGSANRGRCSSPCRALFKRKEEQKHLFSMKDMALKDDVLKLPVTSLKIEGRKKNSLYVAAVTDYYRHVLDKRIADYKKEERIKQIFSRPWCKFNFNGKDKSVVEPNYVGHRGIKIGKIEQFVKGKIIFHTKHDFSLRDGIQIEVPGEEKPFGFSVQFMMVSGKSTFDANAGDEVTIKLPPHTVEIMKGLEIFLASSGDVKNSYNYYKPKPGEYKQKPGVKVLVEVFNDKIRALSSEYSSELSGSFIPADNKEKVKKSIMDAFSKTGDYDFSVKEIIIINPENLFIQISLLNELRRNLYSQISFQNETRSLPQADEPCMHENKGWIIKTDDISCLSGINEDDFSEIIYQISPNTKFDDIKQLPKNKIRIALPTLSKNPENFVTLINKFVSNGYKKWEVGNYWGINILPSNGIDLSFDCTLHMLNSQAIQMAKEMGCSRISLSIEDGLDNMNAVIKKSSIPVVLPVYQDTALFTSDVCIRTNSCDRCNKGTVIERIQKNNNCYIVVLENCMTKVVAENPVCFAYKAEKVNADFYRIDFINKKYSSADLKEIVLKVKQFKNIENSRKANFEDNRGF